MRATRAAAILLLVCASGQASAADDIVRPAAAGPGRLPLEMLEPGLDDIGPVRLSTRFMPYDMRLPTGFDRVYRVPGSDDLVMRGSGALFAVFPRSVYARTARGSVPLAPPGTVFHIGMPGPTPVEVLRERVREQRTHTTPARVDLSIDARRELEPITLAPAASPARSPAPAAAPPARDPAALRPVFPPDPESTRNPYAHLALGPAKVVR
ncbi:MAG: hypothetical protein LW636_11455 [Planctomycetaceae bacterium]|jgi:hypothetical protein|nr:hypothetical protein [Planctomycetaceae bacterium]